MSERAGERACPRSHASRTSAVDGRANDAMLLGVLNVAVRCPGCMCSGILGRGEVAVRGREPWKEGGDE
jgi:hypothetical protein